MISREIEELIGAYWDCAYQEGHLRRPDGNKANKILHDLRRAIEAECRGLDGYVLVPVEKLQQWADKCCKWHSGRIEDEICAMLAAAPKPEKTTAGVQWENARFVQRVLEGASGIAEQDKEDALRMVREFRSLAHAAAAPKPEKAEPDCECGAVATVGRSAAAAP